MDVFYDAAKSFSNMLSGGSLDAGCCGRTDKQSEVLSRCGDPRDISKRIDALFHHLAVRDSRMASHDGAYQIPMHRLHTLMRQYSKMQQAELKLQDDELSRQWADKQLRRIFKAVGTDHDAYLSHSHYLHLLVRCMSVSGVQPLELLEALVPLQHQYRQRVKTALGNFHELVVGGPYSSMGAEETAKLIACVQGRLSTVAQLESFLESLPEAEQMQGQQDGIGRDEFVQLLLTPLREKLQSVCARFKDGAAKVCSRLFSGDEEEVTLHKLLQLLHSYRSIKGVTFKEMDEVDAAQVIAAHLKQQHKKQVAVFTRQSLLEMIAADVDREQQHALQQGSLCLHQIFDHVCTQDVAAEISFCSNWRATLRHVSSWSVQLNPGLAQSVVIRLQSTSEMRKQQFVHTLLPILGVMQNGMDVVIGMQLHWFLQLFSCIGGLCETKSACACAHVLELLMRVQQHTMSEKSKGMGLLPEEQLLFEQKP